MLPKFIRLNGGTYVNLNYILGLQVTGSSSTWHIQVDFEPGSTENLDAVWPTQQDAEDALIKIFQPIDVSLY
jgi:hypothetical protein